MNEKIPQPEIGSTEAEKALNDNINKLIAQIPTQEEADRLEEGINQALPEDQLSTEGSLLQTSGEIDFIPIEKEIGQDPSLN